MSDVQKCPKCEAGKMASALPWKWRYACGSTTHFKKDNSSSLTQTDRCRIQQLHNAIVKVDRMASAWLSHGRDEIKPFAREVFDVCEAAIQG